MKVLLNEVDTAFNCTGRRHVLCGNHRQRPVFVLLPQGGATSFYLSYRYTFWGVYFVFTKHTQTESTLLFISFSFHWLHYLSKWLCNRMYIWINGFESISKDTLRLWEHAELHRAWNNVSKHLGDQLQIVFLKHLSALSLRRDNARPPSLDFGWVS